MAKKMKLGKLSSSEKIKIQEMHTEGFSLDEIAEKLNRGSIIVSNYIDSFTQLIAGEIPKYVESKQKEIEQKTQEKKQKLSEQIAKARERLEKESKLTARQIKERLAHVMAQRKPPKTADTIYEAVTIFKPFMENIARMSEGESRKVAIMTEGASEVLDKVKGKGKSSRMTRGCVFESKPKIDE